MKAISRILFACVCVLFALLFAAVAWANYPVDPMGTVVCALVAVFFLGFGVFQMYKAGRISIHDVRSISGREVQIPTNKAVLAATLTIPADPADTHSVCLMIHGSGPLDRDENIPVQKLNVFNSIAAVLSTEGVASLRYDKRGCGKSTGNHFRASHADTVDDAAACVDYLMKEGYDQSRIVLLGHSEGTIIAAELARRYPRLMGIVLLCPFIQPLEQILMNQAQHMADAARELGGIKGIVTRAILALGGGAVAQQRKLTAKLKATDAPTIRFLLRRLPAASLRGLMALDPPAIYAEVQCPTLIIAGEKDFQCDPNDVPEIEQRINAEVEAHIIPDLTHILRRDPEPPNIFHYTKIMNEPIEAEVLQRVAEWFVRRTGPIDST